MKSKIRSKRIRSIRPSLASDEGEDEDDESNLNHQTFQRNSSMRRNRNANRTATTLFQSMTKQTIERKHSKIIPRSSDQSSLFLYSISSIPKPAAMSQDLTTLTATNNCLTPLTSNQNQTIHIDLTSLTSLSISSIGNQAENLFSIDEPSSSIKSIHFSREHVISSERISSASMINESKTKQIMTLTSDSNFFTLSRPNLNKEKLDRSMFVSFKEKLLQYRFLIAYSSLGLFLLVVFLFGFL